MHLNKLSKDRENSTAANKINLWIGLGITALYGLAGSLFLLPKRAETTPEKDLDIEIRYDTTETDIEDSQLAHNLVKIISMVLSPLQPRISKEEAQLIFVYAGDSWEMRVRNGSEYLRHSVRQLLEAKEW